MLHSLVGMLLATVGQGLQPDCKRAGGRTKTAEMSWLRLLHTCSDYQASATWLLMVRCSGISRSCYANAQEKGGFRAISNSLLRFTVPVPEYGPHCPFTSKPTHDELPGQENMSENPEREMRSGEDPAIVKSCLLVAQFRKHTVRIWHYRRYQEAGCVCVERVVASSISRGRKMHPWFTSTYT